MKRRPSTKQENVFEALGFSTGEAEHLMVRAELLLAVQQAIARRRLRQTEVARVLKVSQPRVSNLLSGRLDLFSTDALIDLLARLGIQVTLSLKPRKPRVA